MSLRTRFIFLNLGITLLPIILMGFILSLEQKIFSGFPDPLYDFRYRSAALLAKQLKDALNRGEIAKLEAIVAPASLVLTDEAGSIVHVSPSLPIGNQDDLAAYVKDMAGIDMQAINLRAGDRAWKAWLFTVPLDKEGLPTNYLPLIPALPLGLILLFTMLMSLLILRSINRAITGLDRATREIAEGNLDFVLPIKGNDALASLAHSMETMRLRLKEEYSRRDRFIMAVSHDLKTPLAVISGYLDAIEDGFADTKAKRTEYLAIMRNKVDVLSHRIAHLIEVAKMTTMEWRQTLVDTDLKAWFDETMRLIGDDLSFDKHPLELKNEMETGATVRMNRDMARRILENLLDNAKNYSPAGSVIAVRLWNRPQAAYITVSNHGSGIAPEETRLVFEPFFRGDHGRNEGGFGLGLASVKSIVEMHGWQINVDSIPGASTDFTLMIPL